MYTGNLKYDDSKNEEVEKSCDNVEEAKVEVDDCINKIRVKPVINVTTDIEGLETSMAVGDGKEKVTDKNEKNDCDSEKEELNETSAIYGCVNAIVVKPVITVDTTISGLNTTITL